MENIIWRSRASALLGILVVILPFLGLPQNFKTFLFVTLGFLIAIFSFARGHYVSNDEIENKTVGNSAGIDVQTKVLSETATVEEVKTDDDLISR